MAWMNNMLATWATTMVAVVSVLNPLKDSHANVFGLGYTIQRSKFGGSETRTWRRAGSGIRNKESAARLGQHRLASSGWRQARLLAAMIAGANVGRAGRPRGWLGRLAGWRKSLNSNFRGLRTNDRADEHLGAHPVCGIHAGIPAE
jgi:hypothetical protein